MDSILLAHVADAIDRISGAAQDYHGGADRAASLLEADPALVDAAHRYDAMEIGEDDFDEIARQATELYGE